MNGGRRVQAHLLRQFSPGSTRQLPWNRKEGWSTCPSKSTSGPRSMGRWRRPRIGVCARRRLDARLPAHCCPRRHLIDGHSQKRASWRTRGGIEPRYADVLVGADNAELWAPLPARAPAPDSHPPSATGCGKPRLIRLPAGRCTKALRLARRKRQSWMAESAAESAFGMFFHSPYMN